jgi:hypothetical protein
MPNELNIALATTGLTVTAQPYQNGAAVGSAISCPETGSTGFYSGNMAGSAGTYQIAFRAAGANVGSGSIVWDGTNEIATSTLTAPQVRTELSTELGRIDAAVSSRLAPSGTLARVTLTDTATTLTNAPAVPTPAQIATQVRTELGTELGRIDAAVSSRLAPSGTLATVTTLTNAPSVPSAADIATQVRTELATELARVDAAVSTRLAGSAYTAPANSDISAIKVKTDALPASPAATGDIPSANISAIKAKTDLLQTDRLAQCSTVATTGAQLAAALS